MAVVTETIDTSFNFPHIDIYKRFYDGVQNAWRAYPQEGYVMYDTNDELTEPKVDPETGDFVIDEETGNIVEVPVIHYFTMAGLPLSYNFDNFSWVSVPRSEVDENYIFGG